MKGTSKLVMGATLVTVVSLALVLGLVMVLLAELYCSLLLRKRRFPFSTTTTTTSPPSPQQDLSVPPPSSFYSQGVLQAPRSFLFPKSITKQEEEKKQEFQNQYQESNTRHLSASSPSPVASPQSIQEAAALQGSCSGHGEHFVYISNPIYDNNGSRQSRVGTPFETPDTSPSRLEMGGSSGDEENVEPSSLPITPPLTPMKKLPSEACSVSLRDARSLGTSGTDSNTNNGLSSSSSSGSPSTSPSW